MQAAIASGDLATERLASYQKLQRELAHMDRRRDAAARHEARQQGKTFAKKVRSMTSRRVWSEGADGGVDG